MLSKIVKFLLNAEDHLFKGFRQVKLFMMVETTMSIRMNEGHSQYMMKQETMLLPSG